VNIGTTGEIAFGEWRKQAWVAGLLATSFVALMLGFSALISVAWRRQDEGISALQKAQEIAKLGNFRFDLETRTISSSAQLQRLFGIGDEHAESVSPWLHAVVEPDAHALLARAHEVLANGQPFEQEFCIVRPSDGSRRWLHCRGIIECQDNTDPIAVAGTIQDITERKDAEDTVKQFNETLETRIAQRTEELEQAMLKLRSFQQELMKSEARATLSMLVASVSHELSTPIGNSVMVASTLKDQARNFQRVIGSGAIKRREFSDFLSVLDEGTTMIETNLLRTEGLLRTFRQVSADQASEQRRSFDLRQVLLDVLKTLEPSLKRQAHRVVLTVPDGIAMDSLPGPIGQIAINLINNAYLHAFEGRENGQLEVGATVDGSQVILHFSDNGCGMSAQQLEHLFEPFFSTKIGRGGTGLGMAIVENLVSKTLGGHIAVRSVLGEGTRFDIQLPQVLPGAASDGEH
jgi:PAS domain S-box-containing protein